MDIVSVESAKLAIMPTEGIVNYFISNQTSDRTKITYSSILRGFFAWSGKGYRDIMPMDALNYNEHLKATCAVATTQNRITALKMFFKFAKDCGLIDGNPFALVKQKSAPNRAGEKYLTTKEIDKLLTALKAAGQREYILGILLASTGIRISEAWELSWSSFVEAPDGSMFLNVLRKGGEYQLLPLRSDVWEAIHEFMNHRPINQFDKHVALFLNPSKERASVVSMRAWILTAGKKAGIKKKCNPHILRHSFATNSLDAKADIRDVSWYLGHSSIKTTSIYTHTTNKQVGEFLKLNID